MKNKDLLLLKANVKKLWNGFDPETKLKFPEDTVLNSSANRKIFENIYKILDTFLTSSKYLKKKDMELPEAFHITNKQINEFRLSNTPISISRFTYSINTQVSLPNMKKLRATEITSWLLNNGYLKEVKQKNGKLSKEPTEKSESIGIVLEEKENTHGEKYKVNLYCVKAQKFILSNLNEMTK